MTKAEAISLYRDAMTSKLRTNFGNLAAQTTAAEKALAAVGVSTREAFPDPEEKEKTTAPSVTEKKDTPPSPIVRPQLPSQNPDDNIPSPDFVKPTPKNKRAAPEAAPQITDILGVLKGFLAKGEDAKAEALLKQHAEDVRKAKDEGIKIGGDTEKRIQRDLATQKKQAAGQPQFFSARDRQKYDLTQKLAGQGLSPKEIAKKMDKMVFGGATNVPGSLEGLPDDFLDINNRTITPPGGRKTAAGLTPDMEWERLFEPRNPPPAAAEPLRGRQVAENAAAAIFGEAWNPKDDDTFDSVRQRRADMIRNASDPNATFGVAGVGEGEVAPLIPGAIAPAGSRAFVSKYGSGFATNTPTTGSFDQQFVRNALGLPAAVPFTPTTVPDIPLPGLLPKVEELGKKLPAINDLTQFDTTA